MTEKNREFPFTRQDFEFLRRIANQRTGIVVTDDKFDMFYSRLSRRVRKLGLGDFAQYCELIRNDSNGEEALELINAITTNLTAFFRENHHFEYLANTLIPELLTQRGQSRTIKAWSAGCSTGEEPYSLAMTLLECLPAGWQAQILATDIDSNVLERAASGIYAYERVKDLAPSRLKRWFKRGKGHQDGKVRVKTEVRELVHFAQLNLMENWQVDGPMDFMFCRNVIIYFDKNSKIRLMDRYADALAPGGLLFIGHSESLYKISDRFQLIGNTIYRKLA